MVVINRVYIGQPQSENIFLTIFISHTIIVKMVVKRVRIVPTTQHSEKRVEQHGAVWNIITEDEHTGRVLVQSLEATARGPNGMLERELIWLNRGEFIRL